jgi:hypothetical protein
MQGRFQTDEAGNGLSRRIPAQQELSGQMKAAVQDARYTMKRISGDDP